MSFRFENAKDGTLVRIPESFTSEYARVVNGYEEGIEYFDKPSDGPTVVPSERGTVGSMRTPDAFQEFGRRIDEEQARDALNELRLGISSPSDIENFFGVEVLRLVKLKLDESCGDASSLTVSIGDVCNLNTTNDMIAEVYKD